MAAIANETITKHEFLEIMTVAVSATSVITVFSAIRIRRIRLWALSSTATNPLGAAGALSLEWKTDESDTKIRLDAQMGIDTAYLSLVPPPKSTAAFWFDSDTPDDNLFAFTCPANSVMDVSFDGVVNSGDYTYLTVVTSGKTAGRMYYRMGADMVPYDLLTL